MLPNEGWPKTVFAKYCTHTCLLILLTVQSKHDINAAGVYCARAQKLGRFFFFFFKRVILRRTRFNKQRVHLVIHMFLAYFCVYSNIFSLVDTHVVDESYKVSPAQRNL